MERREQAAARTAVVTALQRVVSCVSQAVVIQGQGGPRALSSCALGGGTASLSGRRRLGFSLLHQYRLEHQPGSHRRWVDVTVMYHYHLLHEDGTELIRFEWHPYGALVRYPHIHVHDQGADPIVTARTHIPSGRVPLASVVRFAIEELGVRPLRPDWASVLGEGEELVRVGPGA